MAIPEHPPNRVVCYIDGFNVYYGLRDNGLRKYYWLDLRRLTLSLLKPDQKLEHTKYFTSRISGGISGDPPWLKDKLGQKRKRQGDYLEALSLLPDFTLYEGHYLAKAMVCRKCNAQWRSYEEKMTDVNIATELLMDAVQDRFDAALVVSADSDLVPPIRAVRRFFPKKRIVVALPFGRSSAQLKQAATAWFNIHAVKYKKSQLADKIVKPNGHVLSRPEHWR